MAKRIITKQDDGLIMGTGKCSGGTVVDVDAQEITGDNVPKDEARMTGGYLSDDFVYTKPKATQKSERQIKRDALKAIDASTITDPILKAVVESLQ